MQIWMRTINHIDTAPRKLTAELFRKFARIEFNPAKHVDNEIDGETSKVLSA